MENVKCECGHVSPVGTYLCESCGNPIAAEIKGKDTPIDMRYEGVARRSQTYNKTVIDKIWNFFSSVKIAVYMIVIVLVASIVGTIFPQEQYIPVPKPPDVFYEETYGVLGKIYYMLGFHHLFSSWWYVSLLLAIGISLIICSIDRVVPLYKALKNQKVKHSVNFLTRQKIAAEISHPENWDERFTELEKSLQSKRYRVRRDGDALLAEKGRFSRWGPYINHVGLIIFLIGALLRLVPGFYLDQYVWVRDGETKKVPETNYYVKNNGFVIDYYNKSDFPQDLGFSKDEKVVKQYKTDAILYENMNANLPGADPNLKEVTKSEIIVNHPLEYKDLLLYQSGQKPNTLSALNMTLVKEKTGEEIGKFKIDLYDPKTEYQINENTKVQILEYYPDFQLSDDKKPSTKSSNPDNPAFILNVISPQTPNGEKAWLFLGSYLGTPGKENVYGYKFSMPDLTNITGLMVRKDKSLPVIYFGCFICMLGLVMGFYWQHRRIWIQTERQAVYVAAHTNKNWFGLKKEVLDVFGKASVDITLDYRKN